jgi:hypothetical protein
MAILSWRSADSYFRFGHALETAVGIASPPALPRKPWTARSLSFSLKTCGLNTAYSI